jgi:hypothetical protein
MGTEFRLRVFTTLAKGAAKQVVDEIQGLLDAALPTDDDAAAVTASPPPGLKGLRVVSAGHFREDADADALGAYDNLHLVVEAERPPTPAAARERARATGYVDLTLEPAALERLPSCSSTIAIHYAAWLEDNRFFVAVEKRIFERVGDAVVESADGSSLETSETFIAGRAKELDGLWEKTPPAGSRKERAAAKKPRATRAARLGEVEAIAIRTRIVQLVEGDDPFLRDALRSELATTATDAVRTYAAALLEEGAHADLTMAKAMGLTKEEVTAARAGLAVLLDRLRDG